MLLNIERRGTKKMKKLISVLLIIIIFVSAIAADTYEFTEQQLQDLLTQAISSTVDEKDKEIASLNRQHENIVIDKNLKIVNLEIDKNSLQEQLDLYQSISEKQSKLLKWAPEIVVGVFLVGFTSGLLLGLK